jgi:vacuolar-type H+-ATPase subunit C/Vma6
MASGANQKTLIKVKKTDLIDSAFLVQVECFSFLNTLIQAKEIHDIFEYSRIMSQLKYLISSLFLYI